MSIKDMSTPSTTETSTVLRQTIVGSRRWSNFLWATVSAIGGVGFLLAGISSFTGVNILVVSDTSTLQFIPQGLALGFYGVAGSLLSAYLWLVMVWDVGGGYNEFDKKSGKVTIFRQGFPGKNRRIELVYDLADIQAVKAEIKEGLNPKRTLYLKIKKTRDIPLTQVGEPIALSALENQAASLARFLSVPLEGL